MKLPIEIDHKTRKWMDIGIIRWAYRRKWGDSQAARDGHKRELRTRKKALRRALKVDVNKPEVLDGTE